jgi:hypothetical protein
MQYLHSSAIRNSLVGVDALVQFLAVKELLQKLLDLGDTCGAPHQHNLVNLRLFQTGVCTRSKSVSEETY